MQKRFKLLSFAAFLFLLVGLFTMPAVAASAATAEDYTIRGTVTSSGDLQMEQTITLAFSGSVNGFYLDLPKRGSSLEGLVVEGFRQVASAENGDSGVFTAAANGQELERLKIFYPAKKGVKATFRIRYTVPGAAVRGKDTSQLYFYLIGDAFELPISRFAATITVPAVSGGNYDIFIHSDARGSCAVEGNVFTVSAEGIEPGTHLEMNALFPQAALSEVAQIDSSLLYADQKEQEIRWAEETDRQKAEAERKNAAGQAAFWVLTALLPLAAGALCLLLYLKYDREYPIRETFDYYRELPENVPPAQVAVLYKYKKVDTEDLSATVLDLVRRGYLRAETNELPEGRGAEGETGFRVFKTDRAPDDLTRQEAMLYHWLLELGDGESFSFSELEAISKQENTAKSFVDRYKTWRETVLAQAEPYHYFDDKMKGLRIWTPLILIPLCAVYVWLAVSFSAHPFAFSAAGILIAAAASIYAAAIKRRSKTGNQLYHKWRAFRQFLLDFSNLKEAPAESLKLWEHYLVYAIPLGVADKVVDQLKVRLPKLTETDPRAPGFDFYRYFWLTQSMRLYLNHSVHTAYVKSMATISASASRGGGGGFSSGSFGGGGFGGGGGGTF